MSTCKCNDLTCPGHIGESCAESAQPIAGQPGSELCPACLHAQQPVQKLLREPEYQRLSKNYADAQKAENAARGEVERTQSEMRRAEAEWLHSFLDNSDAERRRNETGELATKAMHDWFAKHQTVRSAADELHEYGKRKAKE